MRTEIRGSVRTKWRSRRQRAALAELSKKLREEAPAFSLSSTLAGEEYVLSHGFDPHWPGLLHYQLVRVGGDTQFLTLWRSEVEAQEGAKHIKANLPGFVPGPVSKVVALSEPTRPRWPTTVGGNIERVASYWGYLAAVGGALVFLFMPPRVLISLDADANPLNVIEGHGYKVPVRLTNLRGYTSVDVQTKSAAGGQIDREYVSIKAGESEQIALTGQAARELRSLTLSFHEKAGILWWANDESRTIAVKVWQGPEYSPEFSLKGPNQDLANRDLATLTGSVTPATDKPLECLASVARMPSVSLISAIPLIGKVARTRNTDSGKEFESLAWQPPVDKLFQSVPIALVVRQSGTPRPWSDVVKAVKLECAQ